MCGIIAAIALDSLPPTSVRCNGYRRKVAHEIEKGLDQMHHRGPDARGQWISRDNRIALGHNRLAIKDLSSAGNQPFHETSHLIHLVISGEIYEYERLREELCHTYDFKSNSDSELLLALYLRDGLNFFTHLRGEFAFCLYDEREQRFIAARDRYGIKPLFWTIVEDRLLLASEAKAFIPFGWKPQWDVRSIVEDGWLHDGRTLFKGVRKLLPASYMTCLSFDYTTQHPYWEAEYPDKRDREHRSEDEFVLEVRRHLYESVKLRLQADVPIAIHLSGGIDSATIAGMASDILDKQNDKEATAKSLVLFSVGFDKTTKFDETAVAERTAAHLGRPFVPVHVDEETFANNFEATFAHCEHHNIDLHCVAKFVLSKVTREHGFKVVLTGEGSDEHLGGYNWFYSDFMREPDLSFGKDTLSPSDRQQLTSHLESKSLQFLEGTTCNNGDDDSVVRRKLNNTLCPWVMTSAPFALWTTSAFGNLSVQESKATVPNAKTLQQVNETWHPLNTVAYIWSRSVLANMSLTSLGDRMEMAHSVEGRQPFLDHRFTELANSIPPSLKIKISSTNNQLTEKWILKEAARPFISTEMYERRKHVFAAPYEFTAGGPLHRLLVRLVTRENVQRLGFVDIERAEELLTEAFSSPQSGAIRSVFVIAQWIVLANFFDIPPACSMEQLETTTSQSVMESADRDP